MINAMMPHPTKGVTTMTASFLDKEEGDDDRPATAATWSRRLAAGTTHTNQGGLACSENCTLIPQLGLA